MRSTTARNNTSTLVLDILATDDSKLEEWMPFYNAYCGPSSAAQYQVVSSINFISNEKKLRITDF